MSACNGYCVADGALGFGATDDRLAEGDVDEPIAFVCGLRIVASRRFARSSA